MRKLSLVLLGVLVTAGAAHAQKLSVKSKPIANTRALPSHLQGSVSSMKGYIMTIHDPEYNPQFPGTTPPYELHSANGARLSQISSSAISGNAQYQENSGAKYKVSN